MKVKRILRWPLLAILIILAGFFIRFYGLKYLPHTRLTIALPFAVKDDDAFAMNPMGEKVYHPEAPHGHPGIDFQWRHPVEMLAVADVKVSKIEPHRGHVPGQEEVWNVETTSGIYAIRYQEIIPLPGLKVGDQLKKGDVLGHGGKTVRGDLTQYSVHWEFDYDTFTFDRLCPMTYFDQSSLRRISNMWASVGYTFEGRYPDICSGDYKGRDS